MLAESVHLEYRGVERDLVDDIQMIIDDVGSDRILFTHVIDGLKGSPYPQRYAPVMDLVKQLETLVSRKLERVIERVGELKLKDTYRMRTTNSIVVILEKRNGKLQND